MHTNRFVVSASVFSTKVKEGYYLYKNMWSDSALVLVSDLTSELIEFCEKCKDINQIKARFDTFDQNVLQEVVDGLVAKKILTKRDSSGQKISKRIPPENLKNRTKTNTPKAFQLSAQSATFSPAEDEITTCELTTLGVWMHITNQCNLRCRYCYLHKTNQEMSWDTAKGCVDCSFRTAALEHFKKIKFKMSGGEALLREEFVLKLIDYINQQASQYNITADVVILSNGVYVPSRIVDLLAEDKIRLMISLDGIGKYHDNQRVFPDGSGSFKVVSKTLNRLLQKNIAPIISVTVTNQNAAGLAEVGRFLLQKDLPFSFNLYRENSCSLSQKDLKLKEKKIVRGFRQAYDTISQQLPNRNMLSCLLDRVNLIYPHKYTCGICRSYLVFDQNGQIAKCQMQINNTYANYHDDNPLEIIANTQKGLQNISVDKKQECNNCVWKYYCTGGCPIMTYQRFKSFLPKSPNCYIYKKLIPEVLRLEGLRMLKYDL
jgi:uncharacterized protein